MLLRAPIPKIQWYWKSDAQSSDIVFHRTQHCCSARTAQGLLEKPHYHKSATHIDYGAKPRTVHESLMNHPPRSLYQLKFYTFQSHTFKTFPHHNHILFFLP